MSTAQSLAPLIVAASLVGPAAPAAPVPPPALAEAQLRALNHRVVDATAVPAPAVMHAIVDADFLWIARDGSWHGRDEFLAQLQRPMAGLGTSYDDVRVRLFGPVALLHGRTQSLGMDGQPSQLRYTDVYVWNGTTWRLIGSQTTPMQPGAPLAMRVGVAPEHGSWPGQDPVGDDHSVLTALNENYVRAFRESDVAWYDAHLAADYFVISGDGSMNDRAQALANFARPTFATTMKTFPVDKVRIRRFGDIALIHAENDYELKDGRKGVSRYTDIWHKQNGRWLCVLAHINVHRPPQ